MSEVCAVPLPSGKVWQPKNPLIKRLVMVFSLDVRSLAAFRVSLALVLIFDLIVRAQDLAAHYTDFGVLPRAALLDQFLHPWLWSIHLVSGAWWWAAALFILHGVFALMLLVGYRTRLATIVCWFLLVSLHSRNPMVLQGGDVLLRMLFFWAMFLPLGARYSVDHALNDQPSSSIKTIFSLASVALLLQIGLIYIFSVIHKDETNWLTEGSALYYAFSIDPFAEPLAKYLLKFPEFLKWMSRAVWGLQAVGPWLLLFPLWLGPIRTLVTFVFLGFHLSMTQLLAIGPFPWISAAGWLVVLPPWFWEKLMQLLPLKKGESRRLGGEGVSIYYDLDCGFCRTSVLLLREFLLLPGAVITAAQGTPIEPTMRQHNSWVIVDAAGRQHFGFAGFSALLAASPLLWWLAPVLRLPLLEKIGERLYRRVSTRRPSWSRLMNYLKPAPVRLTLSLPAQLAAAAMLLVVIWWNLNSVSPKRFAVNNAMRWFGIVVDLDQRWNMFSSPLRADGWFVAPGKLLSGQTVDARAGTAYLTYAKPGSPERFYPNQRWQKYMMNLSGGQNRPYLLYYGKYLCRRWNAEHAGAHRLDSFQVVFVEELTMPDGTSAPPKPITLSDHFCFERAANRAIP